MGKNRSTGQSASLKDLRKREKRERKLARKSPDHIRTRDDDDS